MYIYTKHFHEKKLQKTTFQVAIESHAPLSRDLKRKQKKLSLVFSFVFIQKPFKRLFLQVRVHLPFFYRQLIYKQLAFRM